MDEASAKHIAGDDGLFVKASVIRTTLTAVRSGVDPAGRS